jgi:hypothetical protein
VKRDTVEYRKFPEGDVIAIFPEMFEGYLNGRDGEPLVNSYQHIGQHGAASLSLMWELPEAFPGEYADLEAELRQIGYNV